MLRSLEIGRKPVPAPGSRSLAIDQFSARAALASVVIGLQLLAVPAQAEETAPAASEGERWSILVTYGEDDCPDSTNGEIVVCANRPEEERAHATSWTAQFQNHEEEARLGRPNSCSTVGTNGFTGCQAAMLRQWFAERNVDSNE